jgi:NAD(P)-dependent dehydrogenase (short-subunit alcohol dehydrogenase family)
MNVIEKFNLEGKVALITGASKGIGKAIAQALGEAGAKLAISSRNQDTLDEVAKEFEVMGITVLPIEAKVGDPAEHARLIETVIQTFGGIDILINNAATNPVFCPIVETNDEVFDKTMNVNLKGPFDLAKRAYPFMKDRKGGSIINISSIGGISPEPMLGIYSVSKSALISLTKVMAKEWGQDSIRVNAICPGLIKTKFSEALWTNQDILKTVMRQQPLPMLAEPDSIAGLALLLASDAGSFCTGGVYTADGGYTI